MSAVTLRASPASALRSPPGDTGVPGGSCNRTRCTIVVEGMHTLATATATPIETRGSGPVRTTLLELVRAIGEVTDDDREAVIVVQHLLRSGRVCLIGNFRDAAADEFV